MMTYALQELRALSDQASPGPWVYRPDKYDDWGWVRGVERDSEIGRYRPIVANARDSDVREDAMSAHRQSGIDPFGPNALLIVAAVNFVRDLLATASKPAVEQLDGLLPCPNPWCRNSDPAARARGSWFMPPPVRVQCQCGMYGPEAATDAEAITAWNTRAPSTQLEPGEAGFNEAADPLKVAEEMRERCAVFLEARGEECRSTATNVSTGAMMQAIFTAEATAIRALPLTGAGAGGEEG